MVKKIKKLIYIFILLVAIISFYTPFLVSFKLPIPADTIVGLYSPYRDFYAKFYPNGIPYKNFLITDPVRQTYIWRELSVNILKSGNLPLWNPYEMTGKPLIANFQSGVFYPLNFLFFIAPFYLSWSVLIMLQSILGGIFLYLYLRNLKLNSLSCLFASLAFTFSGFSISWLEWGTIVQTAIYLPLLLFSIDKIFTKSRDGEKTFWYYFLFTLAIVCSFLAGYLQVFFYMYLIVIAYFTLRFFESKRSVSVLLSFVLVNMVFVVVTIFQWVPTLQFIGLSARSIDQNFQSINGWFIPWKHLIQFFAPDFFGNPATLNYWGTWNYGELIGFIGVIPLFLSSFSFCKRNSTVFFFWSIVFLGLLFSLPTGISSLPFVLHIPFISSAQPTRLIFVVSFSLAILSAFGFDYLYDKKKYNLKNFIPFGVFIGIYVFLWLLVFMHTSLIFKNANDILIAKRNLFFPTAIFIVGLILLISAIFSKSKKIKRILFIAVVVISFLDLLRFAQKFTPFTSKAYLYPLTKTIEFLKHQPGVFRIAVMDRRIMPPNFFTHYKLQTIEGYDPLYLKSYANYIVSLERNKPDISEPFGFNRIITPHNYNSLLFDFLNTKYVLSYDSLPPSKFTKLFEEGKTKIYLNKDAYDRAFFVKKVINTKQTIHALFAHNLKSTAIISEKNQKTLRTFSVGKVMFIYYKENSIALQTFNQGEGFLVLSDAYYPTWKVFIDGKLGKIYKTDEAFRGVIVPSGIHTILFKDSLF